MTLDELDKDMAIAAVLSFKASTPDRRLAGAEWLQQLAGQLVEAIRAEQPQPEQPAEETPEPEKARYYYNGEPDYLRKIENGKLYAWTKHGGGVWFENKSLSVAEVLERHREITREEAIRIGGEP